jgi:Beta propeller domain/Dockerin type I domain
MKRERNRHRRKLLVERLEARRNMTSFAPDYFADGPRDDFETVKVDSVDNKLQITLNDQYWWDRWNILPAAPSIDPVVPIQAEVGLISTPFDRWYPESLERPKILSVTAPKHGTVRLAEDKLSVIYTPQGNYEGVDQFDYVVEGASSNDNKATVFVNVVQPLLAVDDWFLSKPATPTLDLDVLKNDQFNDALFLDESLRQQFKIVSVTVPTQGGNARIADDGRSLIYSATSSFEGLETLEYTFEDKDGYRDSATVTIRVSQSTTASETVWPEQLRHELLEEVVKRNAHQFGRGVGKWHHHFSMPWMAMDSFSSSAANNLTVAQAGSRTNNQVSGVDEGDLVETDGRFLYVFTRKSTPVASSESNEIARRVAVSSFVSYYTPMMESSSLVIIDTIDPKSPKIVSELGISGRLVGQHVSGNRLVVLTESQGERAKTSVTIVDITDRAAPQVVRSTNIDGSFIQTRLIGDKLYVFASAWVQVPNVIPHEVPADGASFYETGRQFLARLGTDLFSATGIQVANFDEAGKRIGEPINALTQAETLEWIRGTGTAMGIFSFDIDASQVGPFDIDMFETGYSPTIFVSSSSAYIFTPRWDSNNWNWGTTQVLSYAFGPEDGSVSFAAKGNVAGNLLNAFSAAEHNGDLQVFTSTGLEGTQLSVLRRDGLLLKEIGSVKHIAPGEQVYSARFDGDRAFAVTFRRIDPLFVFNLSDPTNPKIEGELKLPGYSQYLHIIDSNHLLGIGRDADENTGLFGSLQVSLFDVSDTKSPKLKSNYQFEGGRQTFSPLLESAFGLSDHHALDYSSESGVLALPLTHYPNWLGPRNEDGTPKDKGFAEVGVLKIDTSTGITDLGGVQSPTSVYRTVQLGEYLYSVAADRIIVTGLLTPSVQHAELLLPQQKSVVPNEPTETGNTNPNVTVTIISTRTNDPPQNSGTSKRQWHNGVNPCDVNGDGIVAPLDVLNVINFIRLRGSVATAEVEKSMAAGESSQALSATTFLQVDVNGDGEVSPLDVLLIINRIRRDSSSQVEGEANSLTASKTDAALATSSVSDWSVPDIEREERR